MFWQVSSGSIVLNVFRDIQTNEELIQMVTDKIMKYDTFTVDDENAHGHN